MRLTSALVLILALAFVLLPYGGVHAASTRRQTEQRVQVGIAEVAVDVVVRDKQGQPVKGLTAADFELFEEGVAQQITSSRLVIVEPQLDGNAVLASRAESPSSSGSEETPRVTAVAFIFDRLSPEGRARARDAAMKYVGDGPRLNSYVGVYAADLSLEVLQPLTRDAQLVRNAIDRAGLQASSSQASGLEQIRLVRDQLSDVLRGSIPNAQPADPSRRSILESQLRLLESFESLQQEQQGMGSISGLGAAIESLRGISGRKAVVFFSEGLLLPPTVESFLRSVIGAASSAHVSVYAVDALGLRTDSAQLATSKEIQSRSNLRMSQLDTGIDTTGGPLTKELERNETAIRLDPRSGLGQLSAQTGGFVISDNNDLKNALRRIDEDLRTYYMLTYAPKDQTVDGRFRRIEVKVKRSGLSVQNRKGYYAVNASYSTPVMEHETPALAVAASGRRPEDMKFRSVAMSFPEGSRTGLVAALAEIPMQNVTFATDDKKKTYSTDFSVVILVKSEARQVVQKLSRRYTLTGQLDALETARKGEVLFYRETDLDPGRYKVQAVVYDALAKKAGMREDTIEVANAGNADLRLSSIVVIRRAERLNAAEQKQFNPFHVGDRLVYPNMGEPLQKATIKQLPFFFTVYPSKTDPKPSMVIELIQRGALLGQLPAELPAADAAGRIQYAGRLPLENFPAGEYEMKITVKSGAASISRSVRFVVE